MHTAQIEAWLVFIDVHLWNMPEVAKLCSNVYICTLDVQALRTQGIS